MTKDELKTQVVVAEKALEAAKAAVEAFDDLPENNVFPNMEDAEYAVEEALRGKASDDCEGSYNCGQESYEREFIVDGKRYIGKLKVEYNRHDKTYYYVDGTEFTVKEKEPV